jgi:hypothetical protein
VKLNSSSQWSTKQRQSVAKENAKSGVIYVTRTSGGTLVILLRSLLKR